MSSTCATASGKRAARPEPPRLVVFDLSTSPVVDLAGARMLATLHSELESARIRLRLVDEPVRDILRAEGLEKRVGNFGRGTSVGEAIDEFRQETGPGGRGGVTVAAGAGASGRTLGSGPHQLEWSGATRSRHAARALRGARDSRDWRDVGGLPGP